MPAPADDANHHMHGWWVRLQARPMPTAPADCAVWDRPQSVEFAVLTAVSIGLEYGFIGLTSGVLYSFLLGWSSCKAKLTKFGIWPVSRRGRGLASGLQ